MKKIFLIIALTISSLWQSAYSQNLIAVQSNGVPSFYTSIDSALNNALAGDTIYLPGGSFGAVLLNKRLHLVGVGHNPDSTDATARTIMSNLVIDNGADDGSISGVYFTSGSFYNSGQIDFPTNTSIDGFTIERCNIQGGISSEGINVHNVVIKENIIGSYSVCYTCSNYFSINLSSANHLISNNILLSKVGVNNCIIRNNIFLFYNGYVYYPNPLYSNNCIVENNIFTNGNGSSNCIFRNNVNGGVNGADGNGNQGTGNFINGVALQSIFVNYNPETSVGEGIYGADFKLPAGSPYKNAGRDGTDIGIYGGAYPWKAGSIPFNPHFQIVKVAPTTDPSGNLNVNIKVAAQDR